MQFAAARLLTPTLKSAWVTDSASGDFWLATLCTNALMVTRRNTWQSSVIQVSIDVQE